METSCEDIDGWKKSIRDTFASENYDSLNILLSDQSQQQRTEKALREETWIFTSLCRLGLEKIVERLLRIFTLDVNMSHDGRTGLQLACKEGHSGIVEMLLHSGAQLMENVWEENSEFYLTTFYGHDEALRELLITKPDLLSDVETRYCLFHCACKGGHLSMVHKWLTPGMDVNREIAYVSSLNDCENQYPLFAACQGRHLEVAEFLIKELNARMTKDVCCCFPEFICDLIRKLFITTSHCREQNFLMSDLELDYACPQWFEDPEAEIEDVRRDSYSEIFETKIDLSKNRLALLPGELLWQLQSLIRLDISWNPLSELPLPVGDACIDKNSLTHLSVSHCRLNKLYIHLFHLPNLESLDASHNQIEVLYEENDAGIVSRSWKCHQLKTLNLAHNCLSSLPSAIQDCVNMESLCVSNNKLTSLCSPWQCPLKVLDVSHNQLSTFPPCCDQFWAESIHLINASHNILDQIHESMVKMDFLKKLDVSFNSISSMPNGSLWTCHLMHLDLSHNKLGNKHGVKKRRVASIQKSNPPGLWLPASCLASSLNELYLDHNELRVLPEGVCDLKALTILDISHNPHLNELPLEMGKLWNLLVLKVEGIKVEDKEIQAMINSLNDPKNNCFPTYDFVMCMEQRRRECLHHDLIKLVVFGCKNTQSECLVQRLISQGKNGARQDYRNDHKSLHVFKWLIPNARRFSTKFKRNLTFNIWEFPVCPAMSVAHPCFLTQNSLYLIVHDAIYEEDQLDKVSQQIAAIQASVLHPSIIVACVFQSFKDKSVVNDLNERLYSKVTSGLKCLYVPVSFSDKSSIDTLYAAIYSKASQMQNVMLGKSSCVVDRKVPKRFVEIVEKMNTIDRQYTDRDELLCALEISSKDLHDTVDRRLKLLEYLLQVGSLLYYDVQMGDLWNLAILDPVWLYDLLSSFMESLSSGKPQVGIERVKNFVAEKTGLSLFPAFISLLELFNIGMRLEESNGKESVLIPSLLSEQPPTFLSDDASFGQSTSRFYCLPAIPNALWSHVISQLIPAFERFSNHNLIVPEFAARPQSFEEMSKSFKRATRKSKYKTGLCVKNKGIQFWRSGIMVWHDQGLVVVEEVKCMLETDDSDSDDQGHGILVTVRTQADSQETESTSYKELAVIGVVTDELEQILELFNPKMMDYMQEIQPFALCPHCHKDITPGQGSIKMEINHFQVTVCAQRIMYGNVVFCGKNAVCLSQLMPEFMFLELPDELRIQFEDLEFGEEKLGHGMAGVVTKGRFKQMDVAIKSFYTPKQDPEFERDEDPVYPNVGCLESLSASMTRQDFHDTERQKVFNAFLDLRREVSILSKLKHKCIIAFLGVCVQSQLLLVLELAPLGSFRSQLNEMKEKMDVSPTSAFKSSTSDPAIITKSIFGKDLTYKILLQIASGLFYLHSKSIIFRDLKPDNVLVLSLGLDAEINVKVSDYGISRFSTAKGVSGLVGTVCYMAPEVLAKQTYTNKVDVYSLGIVMFETLTGISPVDLLDSNEKPMVSEIAKSCAAPLHVKLYKVCCHFPFLENLMEDCWSYRMDDRPSVKDVIKKMSCDQFLLLHDALWPESFPMFALVTCVYACQSGGRMSLWISESAQEGTTRFLSVYDVESSMYTVRRKQVPGAPVVAMAKVKDKIWMISTGCKQIDEIVRSTQNKFEIRPGLKLDQEASCLACHTWSSRKADGDFAFVLIGHIDGTITSSHVLKGPGRTVTTTTKLELGTDKPVSNIVTVSQDSLIASSEHAIFLFTIQEQSAGGGLSNPSISTTWSFSFLKHLNLVEHIEALVAAESCVWCSFEGTNKLVKFNWKEKCVKENLVLFFNSKRDRIDLTVESNDENEDALHSLKPPRPPLRRTTLTECIRITSLCLISDLLAVGLDCGGLCLVPVSSSLQDVCPLKLPVFRHPDKIEKDDTDMNARSNSFLSTSSDLNLDDNGESFSVSKIIMAGSKLVTLLKADTELCVLQKRATLRRERLRSQRFSSVFESSSDEMPSPADRYRTWDGSLSVMTPNQGSKSKCTKIYADIAVWGEMSTSRLDVIKGYREGLV